MAPGNDLSRFRAWVVHEYLFHGSEMKMLAISRFRGEESFMAPGNDPSRFMALVCTGIYFMALK